MAKHGLVVSYYFPPVGGGGVQRWVKFIKYLTRWNWQLTIITTEIEESLPIDSSLLNELPDTIKIIRTRNPKSSKAVINHFFSHLSRGYLQRWLSAFYYITDSRKSWNFLAEQAIDREMKENKYDALMITSPPYSLAELAAKYSAKNDVPVLLDMRDHWTTNPLKIHPTLIHSYIDNKHENRALSGVNFLTTACQSIMKHVKAKNNSFSSENALVITNGYDEEDFTELVPSQLELSGVYNFGFSGSIYSHLNSPEFLFSAMRSLKDEGIEIHFHHIGESVYDISKLAQKQGIQNQLHTWGYLEHSECLKVLLAMDVTCQILDERVTNSEKTIGGKLYEYLRLKKPILAMVPAKGEAAQMIKETNSGIVCPSRNVDEIVAAIKQIIDEPKRFTFDGIEKYKRENLALSLKTFLEEKVSKVR